MNHKSIEEIAEDFGLVIEKISIPEHEDAFRVFKGAKQIFVGTEEATRNFFVQYEQERPPLYAGSMYGYME
jgi:hypothetical protein